MFVAALLGPGLLAATVELSVQFSNLGEPLQEPLQGRFYLYEPEKRERYVAWGHGARPARLEAGVYDLVLRYVEGGISEERLLESFDLTASREYAAEFNVAAAYLTIEVASGGEPVALHRGSIDVHRAGTRGKPLVSSRPGERLTLRPGLYDIEVRYRDPEGLKSSWLSGYSVSGEQYERVEIGTTAAQFRLMLTVRGEAIPPGDGDWEARRVGSEEVVAHGRSGEFADLPAGIYDVAIFYEGELGRREEWLRELSVQGETEQTFELAAPPSLLTALVSNNGRPMPSGWVEIFASSEQDLMLATLPSGETIELPDGSYDLRAVYQKESVSAERWIRGVDITGQQEINIDLELRTSTLIVEAPRRIKRKLDRSNVVILLDNSLQMEEALGTTDSFTRVKREIGHASGLLDGRSTEVSLYSWGRASASESEASLCVKPQLVIPKDALVRRDLERSLESVMPFGDPALGRSLTEIGDRGDDDERTTVIFVTAGAANCDSDGCEDSARLRRSGRIDDIQIIGVNLSQQERHALRCVGKLRNVRDRTELRNAIRTAYQAAAAEDRGRVTVFEPGKNLLIGSAELGQPLQIPEGRYDLRIRVGSRVYDWSDVSILGATRIDAGPQR